MNKKDIYGGSNLYLTQDFEFLEEFFADTALAFVIIDPAKRKIIWLSEYANNLFFLDSKQSYFEYILLLIYFIICSISDLFTFNKLFI